MNERTDVEKAIIGTARIILEDKAQKPNADQREIKFIRIALDEWEQHGAEHAAGTVNALLEFGRKSRELATARKSLARLEEEMPAKLERLEQAARKPSAATMQLELV